MKLILMTYIFAISTFCGRNTENKEPINEIEKSEIINTYITSITYTRGEIRGEYHYGFKYDFTININSSTNLDMLSFCRVNFPSILNGRVDNTQVIDAIIQSLNNDDNVRIDETPKGLRLMGAATELFDAVEVEIYLESNQVLKLDLKYYSPL